jgi:hypothetical protein
MWEGKAVYYHALREASRNYILKSELTSIVWRFQFKQAQDEAGNIFCTKTLSEGSIRSYSSTFDDDFTINSESHMQTMHYTMRTNSKVNPAQALLKRMCLCK